MRNPKSIFDDSTISWQMDNLNELKAVGNVTVGVELQGIEREASFSRGGDGKVGRFNGGHIIAGQDKEIDLSEKKEMTLCIRLCDIEGSWNSPIFARYDTDDSLSKILYCGQVNKNFISYETAKRIKEGKSLEFMLRTEPLRDRVKPEFLESDWYKHLCNIGGQDFIDGIMRIGVPVE